MANPLNDPSTWLSKDLFLIYLGEEGSARYSAFYDQAVAKRKALFFSLNWLALLVFPAWLGYRKQWALFVVYTVMFGALPWVEAVLKTEFPTGAFVGVGIVLGCYANSFLLMNAQGAYLQLKKQGVPPEAWPERLRGRASRSVGPGVGALVLFVATCALSGWLSGFII